MAGQNSMSPRLELLRDRLLGFGPVSFAIVVSLPVLFIALAAVLPTGRETVWVVLGESRCQRERPENPELEGWIEARPCTTCDDTSRLMEIKGSDILVLGSDGIPDACQISQAPYPPGLLQRCFEYGLERIWRDGDEVAPRD